MSTVLNTYILNGLFDSGDLKVFKFSKSGNFKNYFFSPNISIKLFSPRITWMEGHCVSFSFQKYAIIEGNKVISTDNLNLLNLLRNTNEKLLLVYNEYKEKYGHDSGILQPCLFYEKDDHFYIKCNIPNKHIKPQLNYTYTSAIVDIRNIWETSNKIGFRLELKTCE